MSQISNNICIINNTQIQLNFNIILCYCQCLSNIFYLILNLNYRIFISAEQLFEINTDYEAESGRERTKPQRNETHLISIYFIVEKSACNNKCSFPSEPVVTFK